MTYPLKPEVCIQGDRLAVFIGGAYKLLPLEAAEVFVRALQGELARLRRQHKRAKRTRTTAAIEVTHETVE